MRKKLTDAELDFVPGPVEVPECVKRLKAGQFTTIPNRWLEGAIAIPGKGALVVGLRLHFLARCRRTKTVQMNLTKSGISARRAADGLAALERAGLVSVERRVGRPPLVTLRAST